MDSLYLKGFEAGRYEAEEATENGRNTSMPSEDMGNDYLEGFRDALEASQE